MVGSWVTVAPRPKNPSGPAANGVSKEYTGAWASAAPAGSIMPNSKAAPNNRRYISNLPVEKLLH